MRRNHPMTARVCVVSIIRLNPYLARIGYLIIQGIHTRMYTRIQVWLKRRDGIGN
jgi:hypothetical protein